MDKIAVTFSQRAYLFSHRLALSPFFSILEDLFWDRGSGIQRILESISRAVVASQVAIWVASSPSPSSVGWNLLWVSSSTSSISAAPGGNWLALCASSGSGGNWFVKPSVATITTMSLMKSTRECVSPSGSPQGWYGSSVSSCFRPWHLWISSCPFAWFEVACFPRQKPTAISRRRSGGRRTALPRWRTWRWHLCCHQTLHFGRSARPPECLLEMVVGFSHWKHATSSPCVSLPNHTTKSPPSHVFGHPQAESVGWTADHTEGLSSKKPPHHSKPLSPSASGHNSCAIEETLSSTFEFAVATGHGAAQSQHWQYNHDSHDASWYMPLPPCSPASPLERQHMSARHAIRVECQPSCPPWG